MQYNQKAVDVAAEVSKAVFGKPQTIRTIWMAMLAGGHVLIEDIPGVGKTTLALAFARALELNESRVQFTPDVLPSDIVGFTVFQKETGRLVYHPGSVMCNLFLGDEINRTSSRTQSALLEVMEEGTVTVDGVKLLDNVYFSVNRTDKIAFVGENELAQTALFKILMGELEPDEGSVKWGVSTIRSYLPKDNSAYFEGNDMELVDWLRQYSAKKDDVYLRGFLGRMLFSNEDVFKPVNVLSGLPVRGCRTKRWRFSRSI